MFGHLFGGVAGMRIPSVDDAYSIDMYHYVHGYILVYPRIYIYIYIHTHIIILHKIIHNIYIYIYILYLVIV